MRSSSRLIVGALAVAAACGPREVDLLTEGAFAIEGEGASEDGFLRIFAFDLVFDDAQEEEVSTATLVKRVSLVPGEYSLQMRYGSFWCCSISAWVWSEINRVRREGFDAFDETDSSLEEVSHTASVSVPLTMTSTGDLSIVFGAMSIAHFGVGETHPAIIELTQLILVGPE